MSKEFDSAEIADVIDLAVENLEHCAWGQANGRVQDRKICAEDAIWMAVKYQRVLTAEEFWSSAANEPTEPGLEHLRKLRLIAATAYKIRDHLELPVSSLWEWNDRRERTKQEVIDAFKETAKNLRNEASPT